MDSGHAIGILGVLLLVLVSTFAFGMPSFKKDLSLAAVTPSLPSIGGRLTPFGGRVVVAIPCTCGKSTGSTLLTVGPPRGGMFMKTPLTKMYQHYQTRPGVWLLGLAGSDMACEEPGIIPGTCIEIGKGKAINMMGTSR